MASLGAELTWLSYLLRDLGISQKPSVLFCDNLSALHMTINLVYHGRSKHVELDYHFIREKVALGNIVTKYVSTTQ